MSIRTHGALFAAPERESPWPAAVIAAVCVVGAVLARSQKRSGYVVWLLLALGALALTWIWAIYFPPCPPGLWC